jgi:primary-amine oxidase
MHHMKHLLELIAQFPRVNPSSLMSSSEEEVDILRLFQQIRSRYKALCATLGIRPTLRAATIEERQTKDEDVPVDRGHRGLPADDRAKEKVWSVDRIGKRSAGEELSF